MVNKKSIAFISTPFQLLCLKELIVEEKLKNIEIIFIQVYNDNFLIDQITKNAFFLNLTINKFIKFRSYRLNYLYYVSKFFLKKKKYLIFGAYFNSHFQFLSKLFYFDKLFFVDDGLETTLIGDSMTERKSLMNSIFKPPLKCNQTHFTIFKNPNILRLKKNNFNFIKTKFKKKRIKNIVFILGTNLVESKFIESK